MKLPLYDLEALPEVMICCCQEDWANNEYTLRDEKSR